MFKRITIIICVIFFHSCSDKEIPFDSLVERAGLYYEVNQEKPFSGDVFKKLENGQYTLTGSFDKGFKSGEWIEYYDNGQKRTVRNYSSEGKLNGVEEKFIESGQLISKGSFKDNQKSGLWENYYNNGSIKFKGNYSKDDYNGLVESFFENGTPKFKGTYLNTRYDGLIEEWYSNGNKKSEINYSNGVLNGSSKEFSNQGFLKRDFNYKDDKKDGLSVIYYSKNKKYTSTNYKNGIKDGLYEEWYDNKQQFKEFVYDNGRLKTQKFWNKDGTIRPILRNGILGKWKEIRNSENYGWSTIYSFKNQKKFNRFMTKGTRTDNVDGKFNTVNNNLINISWYYNTVGGKLDYEWKVIYMNNKILKVEVNSTSGRKTDTRYFELIKI